uniref:Uncharacterized protein n=1 Tax=Anguilla anguilla TaxID=7936 RepID=A0A0E9S233_ANGAN
MNPSYLLTSAVYPTSVPGFKDWPRLKIQIW